jgi:uncharacterized protein YhbP (UPF0306 family)
MTPAKRMNIDYNSIVRFIKEHHVLTLATCADNLPYCFNAFYVFLEEQSSFIFTSDRKTRHIREAEQNTQVAGSIVLETETVGKIQGLQFCGEIKELQGLQALKGRMAYLKRFPYAVLTTTPLWTVEMNYAKLTDNRLGFGKKIIWTKKV